MMWTLIAMMIFLSSASIEKTLSMNFYLTMEIINLSLMSTMVMSLNNLMTSMSSSKEQEKMLLVISTVGVMVTLSFSTDSPMIYLMMMEMTVIPLTYMILNTSKEKEKLSSLKFMVLMNTLGSVPFMVYVYWGEEMLNTAKESNMLSSKTGIIIMLMLFIIKTPMFLTHMWLTKVHVEASGNCSMMLASIMIKMGTVGMLKFSNKFNEEALFYYITSTSLTGAIYLTLIMYRYFDSKTLIAMSSVLHMAMVIPMVMMKENTSMGGSIMMMSAHGLISYYLFYLVTIKYEMSQNRTSIMLKSEESMNKTLTMILITFMFLNLGMPPFMNFISETCFMSVFLAMNCNTGVMAMAMILMASVMFTMQINSTETYGKKLNTCSKMENISISVKSLFFLIWSFAIIYCL